MQQEAPSIDTPLLLRAKESKAVDPEDVSTLLSMLRTFHDYAVSFTLAPQKLYVENLHLEQIWEQIESNYLDIDILDKNATSEDDRFDAETNDDSYSDDDNDAVMLEDGDTEDGEESAAEDQEGNIWNQEVTAEQARAIEAEIRAAEDCDGEEEDVDSDSSALAQQVAEMYEEEPALKRTEPRKPAVYSDFELARMRLQATIQRIEDEMMNRPTWEMAGEVSAYQRPADGLLRKIDDIDFDIKQRPRVQLTEELNENIEKLISIRCRDDLFDDPVYFSTADNDQQRKDVVISDAKSHKALGDDIKDAGIDKVRARRDGEVGVDSGSGPGPAGCLGDAAITGSTTVPEAIRAKEDECFKFFAELECDLHAYTSFYAVSSK